ncbi:MAG: ribonuclease P protein component [Alphaproteobacteria bacterium]|nr:ribonuclease P protein component [Alphaproteobacteria bacterium]
MKVLILKKRKEFVRVAKGLKVVTPSLILQAAQSLYREGKIINQDCCYLGYTATKKIGKAHLRNRTKRRLRAAATSLFAQLGRGKTDYVLIGRYNTADTDFANLKADMEKAIRNINQQLSNPKEKKHEATHDFAN